MNEIPKIKLEGFYMSSSYDDNHLILIDINNTLYKINLIEVLNDYQENFNYEGFQLKQILKKTQENHVRHINIKKFGYANGFLEKEEVLLQKSDSKIEKYELEGVKNQVIKCTYFRRVLYLYDGENIYKAEDFNSLGDKITCQIIIHNESGFDFAVNDKNIAVVNGENGVKVYNKSVSNDYNKEYRVIEKTAQSITSISSKQGFITSSINSNPCIITKEQNVINFEQEELVFVDNNYRVNLYDKMNNKLKIFDDLNIPTDRGKLNSNFDISSILEESNFRIKSLENRNENIETMAKIRKFLIFEEKDSLKLYDDNKVMTIENEDFFWETFPGSLIENQIHITKEKHYEVLFI